MHSSEPKALGVSVAFRLLGFEMGVAEPGAGARLLPAARRKFAIYLVGLTLGQPGCRPGPPAPRVHIHFHVWWIAT